MGVGRGWGAWAKLNAPFQRQANDSWAAEWKRIVTCLNLLAVLLFIQPQVQLFSFAAKAHHCLMFSQYLPGALRSFPVSHQLVPMHLSLSDFMRFLLAHSYVLLRSFRMMVLSWSLLKTSSRVIVICSLDRILLPPLIKDTKKVPEFVSEP